MKKIFHRLRAFSFHLGLVEQAQIVASTGVVVMMVTIISANIVLNKTIGFFEFISIVTVGVIGFTGVYFSLKYGRQFEEQNCELVALNTVAQTVNRMMELGTIFETVLTTVTGLLKNEYGWLYIIENETLVLKRSSGVLTTFFDAGSLHSQASLQWLQSIHTSKETRRDEMPPLHPQVGAHRIASWVVVPLRTADRCAGAIILASSSSDFFSQNKINLISAFGNQINVALNNAHMFSQLKKSQEQYADLFEHSPDMYHLIDRSGTIIGCNQTEAATLGYDKQEIVNTHLTRIYPSDQHAKVQEFIRCTFELEREARDEEHQMIRRDGTRIDVSVNSSFVYNEIGVPVSLRCVVRDITEKKKFEEKIIQAQKIDSIGNLAGGVAHDFNNLLTSIGNAAAIMKRRVTTQHKLFPFIEIITLAAQRGAKLTTQLLTFARRTPAELHTVDLHLILDETLALFETGVPDSVTIARQDEPMPVFINGDEGQIQQSILNILLNARDAMPDGGSIAISTAVNPHDRTVTLSVTDTGTGMDVSVKQHIFEPFYTTKESGKGTGLGLSVVYGVMKSHNGSVSVTSTPGKGSTFALTFPLLWEQAAQPSDSAVKISKGNGETVLIVDDEAMICYTLSTMLKDLGYAPHSVQSGKEALELLGERSFDLMILDMTMPQMNGEKLFQKIKRKKFPGRILISSGYNDAITTNESFVKNVDGFLRKPYVEHELASKLQAVLTMQLG
ncbi:MAG TPA: ATP-binding protein [Bacteroidota bacterium]|nr:ATP-binding protein [Bacteroidota bacterium]